MTGFNTLVALIDNSLRSFGPHPLFGTKLEGAYRWTSYREFGEQLDKARAALAATGFKAGERLGIISANRVEWAVLAFAAYQLGGVVVPMYESQNPDDWAYIIHDAEPAALAVSKPKIFERLATVLPGCPSVRQIVLFEGNRRDCVPYAEWLEAKPPVPAAAVKPEQLAGLIYTSGTTGRPKGVMLSHGNFASNVSVVKDLFPIGPGDVSLSFLPWAHAFGQTCELYGLISVGAAMGLAERVETLLENLTEVRPTLLVSVPRIFNRIYEGLHQKIEDEGGLKKKLFYAGLENTARLRDKEAAHKDGPWAHLTNQIYDKLVFSKVKERFGGRMKFAFSGGAALAPEVAKFIDHLNIVVYEGYGLSETSPIISANHPGSKKIGSVGKPIPGVTVKLDYSKGTMPGEGEIINYGPNNMLGYYNLPKETAETLMPDGGLRTGDLGRLDEDGFLFVTGRVKDLFKLENGKYVAPVPLEEELQLSPYILQAMLYGNNLPFNVVLVVPELANLHAYCRQRGMPEEPLERLIQRPAIQLLLEKEVARIATGWKSYERPRKVIPVSEEWTIDNDLLTPTLKVKRKNVVAKYKDLLVPWSAAPRGAAPAHVKEEAEGTVDQEERRPPDPGRR